MSILGCLRFEFGICVPRFNVHSRRRASYRAAPANRDAFAFSDFLGVKKPLIFSILYRVPTRPLLPYPPAVSAATHQHSISIPQPVFGIPNRCLIAIGAPLRGEYPDSIGSGKSDSRSNPIRIMRSCTPVLPLKFDVQCFQRFTNSPCNRCINLQCFLTITNSGGEGGILMIDSKRTASPQLPLLYRLQNQHLYQLARNPCRFNTCAKAPRGVACRISSFGSARSPLPDFRFSFFDFRSNTLRTGNE